ncbi:MAG: hypothetical protein H6523_01725 [Mycolicibacterium sp.]|nr:hypothetical protein [Mycolicibacterium sp.]
MPIYLLGARTPRVEIPNEPLAISIAGQVGGAALYIAAEPGQHIVRVNAQLVILPTVTGPITVGVEPAGIPAFPHGTVVHLGIGPESTSDLDPVQVTFEPVDVSGAGAMELAGLTPAGSVIEVEARAVADTPLGPLANMARTAARRGSGTRQRSRGGSLRIAVDASASMLPAFADGSVAAAVDVIIGVADVAGINQIDAVLVGSAPAGITAPLAELAQAVGRAQVRFSAGARWSAIPDGPRTVAITDGRDFAAGGRFPALRIGDDPRLAAAGPVLVPAPQGVPIDRFLTENTGELEKVAAALLRVLT